MVCSIIRPARDDNVHPAFRRRACSREPHKLGGAGHCDGRNGGCAVGAREDGGGTGAGFRAGAAGGCGGASGIFISISTIADSSLSISRLVWS